VVVSKYGAKKSMILAAVAYSLFLYVLPDEIRGAHLCCIGIAWNIRINSLDRTKNSYLIRASGTESYGRDAGYFNTYQTLGSALGALIFGILALKLMFGKSFLIYSVFPLAGILVLSGIKDIKVKEKTNRLELIRKALFSATALRLSCLWFAVNFIHGLIIGIIPVEIGKNMGIGYIGLLSSLFYILPISASYHLGKLSDSRGRKNMIILSYAFLILGCLSLMQRRPVL